MRIRFHLDEHISSSIASGLRRRNIDVTEAAAVGLAGSDDLAHLTFATSSGRVLVTQDSDFLRMDQAGSTHAGIAYSVQGSISIGEMLRRLILMYGVLSPEQMKNRVEFL